MLGAKDLLYKNESQLYGKENFSCRINLKNQILEISNSEAFLLLESISHFDEGGEKSQSEPSLLPLAYGVSLASDVKGFLK